MPNATASHQGLYVDPALFTETARFAGVFQAEGKSTSPVSIELSYSRTNDHPPYGIIRGTAAEYDRLELFFRRFHAPYRLESVSQEIGRDRFVAERTILRSLHRTPYPNEEAKTVHQIIGEFEVIDFSIFHRLRNPSNETRKIIFFMAGPSGQWAARSLRRSYDDGNIKTEHLHPSRSISGCEEIKMNIQRYYLHCSVPNGEFSNRKADSLQGAHPHRSFMVEAELVSLEIEDLSQNTSDEYFCTRAIDIVDAAADITSFISKASTQWYSYRVSTLNSIKEHFRGTQHDRDPGYHYDDHVVGEGDVPEFLGIAVGAYLQRRKEGLDLKLPLRQYVATHRARYINDQLSTIYNALEQIVSMVPDNIKGGHLLQKGDFRLFKRVTERTLLRLDFPEPICNTIINKLRNTTDPGFRGKLTNILKHWDIDIEDIGGEKRLASACQTRNALIHSHTEPDIKAMIQGRNFLVTLFERLALKLLGWSGRIVTPTPANRSLLQAL